MSLNKASLAEHMYAQRHTATRAEAAEMVNVIFDLMKETLASGESLKLSGFGNFAVMEKRARTGRNPQTGEAMEIAERRIVSFKVSAVLKNEMQSK